MFNTVKFSSPRSSTGVSRVIGVPGGGLSNGRGGAASWAANEGVAKFGAKGEQRTAVVIDKLVRPDGPGGRGGATVLHDLDMPMKKITANIDHIVVSGTTVTLLDSKSWKPGFLWTFAGSTRRGWRRFGSADKPTMKMARTSIAALLRQQGVEVRFNESLVVVWPTNSSQFSMWAARFPGAKLVLGAAFERKAARLCGTEPADPRIVDALTRLVVSERGRSRSQQRRVADMQYSSDFPARSAAPRPAPVAAPIYPTAPVIQPTQTAAPVPPPVVYEVESRYSDAFGEAFGPTPSSTDSAPPIQPVDAPRDVPPPAVDRRSFTSVRRDSNQEEFDSFGDF